MNNCCCYNKKCAQCVNYVCLANHSKCKDRKAKFNALERYKEKQKLKQPIGKVFVNGKELGNILDYQIKQHLKIRTGV